MKILTLHCDYIKFKPLKKAIKNAEELDEKDKKEKEIKEPLVVLTAVEEGDNDKILKDYLKAIKKTAEEVKAKKIVIYPYAHLSSNLASPDTAREYMTEAEHTLKEEGYDVTRAPFGYYKEFELKCKGHPLSELAKEFSAIEKLKLTKEEISKIAKAKVKGEETDDPAKLLREISRTKLDTSKLKENDHRILGQKLDLFSFNEVAPGAVFWHNSGLSIYNELISFMRNLLREHGYLEVSTPQIFDNNLWKVSGHWQHYKENMFLTSYEDRDFGVKPMNCPGGMLIYKTKTRSYKDLPMRIGEFGIVHRQELSGVLAGMFRVIKFTQDDAHIFCTKEQIESEIEELFNLIKIVYKDTFGFDYTVELSTRPEKFMGKKENWELAENILEKVMKKYKMKYKVCKGRGAFYGPKIDFHLTDSLGRTWQCGTIQLDMQMPERFGISYVGKDNKEQTPFLLHRTILGSTERFIAILLEHFDGKLPLWLSPIQVRVINFTDRNTKATEKIVKELKEKIPNLRIDSDFGQTTVSDKVRNAEIMRVNYIVVIGDKEEENETLAVRPRGEKPKFGVRVEDFVAEIKEKIEKRSLE